MREGLRTGMAAQLGVAAGAVVVALASASVAPATLYSPAATVGSAPTVRPTTAALSYAHVYYICRRQPFNKHRVFMQGSLAYYLD